MESGLIVVMVVMVLVGAFGGFFVTCLLICEGAFIVMTPQKYEDALLRAMEPNTPEFPDSSTLQKLGITQLNKAGE